MENLFSLINSAQEREFILPSGRLIRIKEMDGWCEDLLVSEASQPVKTKANKLGKKPHKAFDQVAAYCTTYLDGCDKNVTPDDILNLYSYDYLFLVIAMRIVSRGDSFQTELRCENCGTNNVFVFDSLTDEVLNTSKKLEDLKDVPGVDLEKEEYHVTIDKVVFVLKILKAKDQNILDDRIKLDGNKKNSSHSLLMACKGWYKKGEKPETIQPLNIDIIRKLPLSYTMELKNRLMDIKFGPDISIESNCLNCGSDMEGVLMTKDFFLAQTQTQKSTSCGNSNAEQDIENSCQCPSQ